MYNDAFWLKHIDKSWYERDKEFWNSDYMKKLIGYLGDRYKKATVYPEKDNIFRAFRLTPFDKVRVVILGQDPYPDGSATGLAFANSSDTLDISPSLKKIYESVERDMYEGLLIDFDYTLEEWAEQGVLLLNTALTVEKFNIGAHSKYWETFTQHILSMLLPGTHVCLWGNHAKMYEKFLKDCYVYKCTHPASAHYNKIDWKCDNFREINKNIYEQTKDVIVW